MLTSEQLEMRKTGLGSSEVAAAIGISPHRSPFSVYADKIGAGVPFVETEPVVWGNLLEPVIAQYYAERHPASTLTEPGTIAHPDEPWMLATPDRHVHGGRASYGLEIKTAGFRQYNRWGETAEKLPPEYMVQCDWCMAVTGYDRWDMAVLIAGQEYREYTIEREETRERLIVDAARRFWFDHVVPRNPPKTDAMASTKLALQYAYTEPTGEWVSSDADMNALAEECEAARVAAAKANEHKLELEARVKATIADNEGVIGDWGKASWKHGKDGKRRFTWKYNAKGGHGG